MYNHLTAQPSAVLDFPYRYIIIVKMNSWYSYSWPMFDFLGVINVSNCDRFIYFFHKTRRNFGGNLTLLFCILLVTCSWFPVNDLQNICDPLIRGKDEQREQKILFQDSNQLPFLTF